MSLKTPINIVGGGFSGLTQAFYLAEAGYKVVVHEKKHNCGGLIGSHQEDEFLVENAANAMIANQELERISQKIGVPLQSTLPASSKRYILNEGKMDRWPLSPLDSLPLLPFLIKKSLGTIRPKESETLNQWASRVLSKKILEKLVEPALQGVYATSSDRLNARLVFDSFNKKIKKAKLRGSVAPAGGMQQWIEGLKSFIEDKGGEIITGDSFDHFEGPVILAVDLGELRRLTNENKIVLPESVLKTSSLSLSSVVLCFNKKTDSLVDGFGCLFPKSENFNSLGVLFNHNIFSGRVQSGASETWILNDSKMNFSTMSTMALERYVLSDRFELFEKQQEPTSVHISQWNEKIPLYDAHLAQFISDLKTTKTSFLLMGNYLGDLGLGKLIFRAKNNMKKVSEGYFE